MTGDEASVGQGAQRRLLPVARLEAVRATGVEAASGRESAGVRDLSACALRLHERSGATEKQAAMALRLVRRPAFDAGRFERIWKGEVLALRDCYRMNE